MDGGDGYRIRPALAGDVERLPAIELAAAALFDPADVGEVSLDDVTDVATLAAAQREGRLFVAVHGGEPIGFALAGHLGGEPFLLEIDVFPGHGRRGVGAALVRAAVEWARARGERCLSLSTFRHVPWNAPFYAKLGFRALAEAELSEPQRALREREAANGLATERRVVMRLALGAGS